MSGPWRGIEHRDRLVDEGVSAHHPVERILNRAGDPMRVFRAGYHHRVCGNYFSLKTATTGISVASMSG